MSEMLAVKEWAKRSGLKLKNYDGFVGIYEKLSGESTSDFSTHMVNRMRDAGEIFCTRRAFEAGLYGCTMEFPTIDDFETMLEVIPGFVEDDITRSISMSGVWNKGQDSKSEVEYLLKAMKIKLKAREKRIELGEMTEKVNLQDIEGRLLKPKEIKKIERYGTTVEDAELNLLHEIIGDLENLLKQKTIKRSQLPNQKIEFVIGLYYDVFSKRKIGPSEEEYMYINIPGMPKEPFVQPYTMIGLDGAKAAVAFDIQTPSGKVRGSIRTSSETDAKLRGKQYNQEDYEDITYLNESAQEALILDEEEKINHSLEVIDSSVPKESRVNFMDKLENFVKKIRNFFRRDGEGR